MLHAAALGVLPAPAVCVASGVAAVSTLVTLAVSGVRHASALAIPAATRVVVPAAQRAPIFVMAARVPVILVVLCVVGAKATGRIQWNTKMPALRCRSQKVGAEREFS